MNETQIEYCNCKSLTPHRKGYRVCSHCKVEKKFSEFYPNKKNAHGFGYCCKECTAVYKKKVYDPVRMRNKWYMYNYGITLDDYNRMLKIQNNRCAICNGTETGRKDIKYFNVDHCHTTGKVRGLLCHGCNSGIGNMKDDVELLDKAIAYLKEMNK